MSDRPQGRDGLRGRRASRRARQEEQREQQRVAWGGPVDVDRVLAFSDAIFAIAITLLTLKLEVRPGLRGPEFTRDLRDLRLVERGAEPGPGRPGRPAGPARRPGRGPGELAHRVEAGPGRRGPQVLDRTARSWA
jgi:hypothetical protein